MTTYSSSASASLSTAAAPTNIVGVLEVEDLHEHIHVHHWVSARVGLQHLQQDVQSGLQGLLYVALLEGTDARRTARTHYTSQIMQVINSLIN
jgi:hypothetical protein